MSDEPRDPGGETPRAPGGPLPPWGEDEVEEEDDLSWKQFIFYLVVAAAVGGGLALSAHIYREYQEESSSDNDPEMHPCLSIRFDSPISPPEAQLTAPPAEADGAPQRALAEERRSIRQRMASRLPADVLALLDDEAEQHRG